MKGGKHMEQDKERIPNGYLIQYEDKARLGETFDALTKIADEHKLELQLLYRESLLKFFQAKFGQGQHTDDLEAKLKETPNIAYYERDYLERKI